LAPGLLEQTGRSRAELESETAELLEQCPAVEAVWTSTELAREVDELDPFLWLYANSYYPERSADFLIQFEEYFMASLSSVTTHGSPYAYDTRVPMIILAPGLASEALEVTARTVDLAPTLASLAGVPIPEEVDGSPLIGLPIP
jgi:predicted AlkP superfamily pyrophosphatase or phosphodiesterase